MVEICMSSMHPSTLEILKDILIIGLLPDVTERCYQVNVIYQISQIQSCDTPLWRICAQEDILRMSESDAHFLQICIQDL